MCVYITHTYTRHSSTCVLYDVRYVRTYYLRYTEFSTRHSYANAGANVNVRAPERSHFAHILSLSLSLTKTLKIYTLYSGIIHYCYYEFLLFFNVKKYTNRTEKI